MRARDERNLIARVSPDDAWLLNKAHHAPMIVSMVDIVNDRDNHSASGHCEPNMSDTQPSDDLPVDLGPLTAPARRRPGKRSESCDDSSTNSTAIDLRLMERSCVERAFPGPQPCARERYQGRCDQHSAAGHVMATDRRCDGRCLRSQPSEPLNGASNGDASPRPRRSRRGDTRCGHRCVEHHERHRHPYRPWCRPVVDCHHHSNTEMSSTTSNPK